MLGFTTVQGLGSFGSPGLQVSTIDLWSDWLPATSYPQVTCDTWQVTCDI